MFQELLDQDNEKIIYRDVLFFRLIITIIIATVGVFLLYSGSNGWYRYYHPIGFGPFGAPKEITYPIQMLTGIFIIGVAVAFLLNKLSTLWAFGLFLMLLFLGVAAT